MAGNITNIEMPAEITAVFKVKASDKPASENMMRA
jgi:hypothetical protein